MLSVERYQVTPSKHRTQRVFRAHRYKTARAGDLVPLQHTRQHARHQLVHQQYKRDTAPEQMQLEVQQHDIMHSSIDAMPIGPELLVSPEPAHHGVSVSIKQPSKPAPTTLLQQLGSVVRDVLRDAAGVAVYIVPVAAAAYVGRHQLTGFWGYYNLLLDKHPLLTKIATGAVGTLLGDFMAQYGTHVGDVKDAKLEFEEAQALSTHTSMTAGTTSSIAPSTIQTHLNGNVTAQAQSHEFKAPSFHYDVGRVARLVLYGSLVGTPIAHYWFGFLDKAILPLTPKAPLAVLGKMLLDQLVACPILTSVFFASMRTIEGHPEQAAHAVQEKLWPTLKANYMLWPAVQAVNFAFVPSSQRILFCNIVGVFWACIVSSIVNARPEEVKVE